MTDQELIENMEDSMQKILKAVGQDPITTGATDTQGLTVEMVDFARKLASTVS